MAEESSPEEILMVAYRLVRLQPAEYQVRLTGENEGREVETAGEC
jgi:hypothetical protein